MKNIIRPIAFAIICLTPLTMLAQGQPPKPKPGEPPAAVAETPAGTRIPSSEHWDFKSKVTGRTYRIFVSRPLQNRTLPAGGAPIFYVLDANAAFDTAREAAWSGAASWWSAMTPQIKPALVVGIGYPTEDLDLVSALRGGDFVPHAAELRSKAHAGEFSDADKEVLEVPLPPGTPPGEGAEKFFRFIQEELQPQLVAKYGPLNTADVTLWGHSLGGLFVLDTLFKHPTAFRSYVISSPVISFQNRRVLQSEASFIKLARSGQAKPRVLILSGGNEGKPYPQDRPLPPGLPPEVTREMLTQLYAETRMLENARELAQRLSAVKGLPVQYWLFADEDHQTMVPASISRAVTFGLAVRAADEKPSTR
jgi:uncharacterized protein